MRTKKEWNETEIQFLIDNYPSKGCDYCSKHLGIGKNKIHSKRIQLGLYYDGINEKYRESNFREAVIKSINYMDLCRNLGIAEGKGNMSTLRKYIKLYSLDISHFTYNQKGRNQNNPRPIEYYLVSGSNIKSNDLKRKLYKSGLKEPVCEKCGQDDVWMGNSLVMQLDHINGDNTDNRLENLRILCPNCHTQTETHSGKNNVNKTVYSNKTNILLCDCGKRRNKKSNNCRECSNKLRITTTTYQCGGVAKQLPKLQDIIVSVETIGFTQTGKIYGVSDNAVRKWLTKLGVDFRSLSYKTNRKKN